MVAVASTVIAPIGQTAAQAPQPVHRVVFTAATKELGRRPPTCICAIFSLVAFNSCSVARAWALRPWSSWSLPLGDSGGGGVVGADTCSSPIWGGGAVPELGIMPLPRPIPLPGPRPFPAARPPPRPFPRPLPRPRAQPRKAKRRTRFKYPRTGRPAPRPAARPVMGSRPAGPVLSPPGMVVLLSKMPYGSLSATGSFWPLADRPAPILPGPARSAEPECPRTLFLRANA